MRIESIRFRNFKLLRDTTLPLEPLTVIVGPNNSGKSSVFDALAAAVEPSAYPLASGRSLGVPHGAGPICVATQLVDDGRSLSYEIKAELTPAGLYEASAFLTPTDDPELARRAMAFVRSFRAFIPDARRIRVATSLVPNASLTQDGSNLAAVLDQLRDRWPERWEALNAELGRWLPEFDRVLFETPDEGKRLLVLRTALGGHRIPAHQLSTGTLLVLALLAVLYAEDEARVIGIEEPEIGVHPRLLRGIRDTLLRMAYPVENGESWEPRQVIVTTHSPYFLELFREDPDNVVIAERVEDAVHFRRLIDLPHIDEILGDSSLGDAWFSGILGGVPMVR